MSYVELGRIEHKHRDDPGSLTAEERACYEAVLEDQYAVHYLSTAAEVFIRYMRERVRAHGGKMVTERVRIARNGHVTRSRWPRTMACRTTYTIFECPLCGAHDLAPELDHRSLSCGDADVVELLLEPISPVDLAADSPRLASTPRTGHNEYWLRRSMLRK